MALQHLRSNTASKRPTAGAMSDGQIAINTNATSPGLFFKDAGGSIIKVGPVHVGTTAPNSSPAGSTGNSIGEQWLDTSGGGYVLKIWDGSAWRSEVGEFVDAAGDTMTGALILPSGTAAAPALGVGSTDNGLYSPGTDQVAISTNGTGRLFVDANGNVGVSTTSPLDFLHVSGNIRAANSAGGRLILEDTDQADASTPFYLLASDSGNLTFTSANRNVSGGTTGSTERLRITSTGQIQSGGLGSAASPALSFSSDTNTGIYSPGADQLALSTNGTGRLFVDASGNVGVGVSSGGLSSNDLLLVGNKAIRWQHSTNGTQYGDIYTDTSSNIVFRNGGSSTESLRITSAGLVGIGTSDPASKLSLELTGISTGKTDGNNWGVNGVFQIGNSDGGTFNSEVLIVGSNTGAGGSGVGQIASAIGFGRGTSGWGTYLNFYTHSDSTANIDELIERVRIDSSGRVGIGTTSPQQPLHVNNAGSSACRLLLQNTGSSAADSTQIWSQNNDIVLNAGSNERARIDSSGRLLVGTSSSSGVGATLQVIGDTAAQFHRGVNDASGAGIAISKSRNTAYGSYNIVQSGDLIGTVSFRADDGTDYNSTAALIGCYVDGTPGANDMPGRLVFSTTADGASSPTERMRIDSNGAVHIFDNIRPWSDNVTSLGTASKRWSVVYAGTGTINTSDASLKQDIEDLEQTELNVATAIKGLIKKFRFIDAVTNKGDDARIHVGVIAQDVEQAFIAEGLDPRRYALFCEDTLEDGSKRLGIRYDELLSFVIAALQ